MNLESLIEVATTGALNSSLVDNACEEEKMSAAELFDASREKWPTDIWTVNIRGDSATTR